MAEDVLWRLRALLPDEVAAAERLAGEEAAAIRIFKPLPFRGGVGVGPVPQRKTALDHRDLPHPNPSPEGEGLALADRSLAGLAAAFADGTLTPPDLLATLLNRIDRLDPPLNSFVALDRDGASAAAKASAVRWKSGTQLGPLDGIPVGIKDVIDVADFPTRCHSHVTSADPVATDAAIVAQLRAAGAVILGKLATHEFAIGGPAFDLPFRLLAIHGTETTTLADRRRGRGRRSRRASCRSPSAPTRQGLCAIRRALAGSSG